MNRDHLMGYSPAANVSADCPTEYDDFNLLYVDEAFPFGVPRRVLAEMESERVALKDKRTPLRDFERMTHPNPDGSFTTAKGSTFRAAIAGKPPQAIADGFVYYIDGRPVSRAEYNAWMNDHPDARRNHVGLDSRVPAFEEVAQIDKATWTFWNRQTDEAKRDLRHRQAMCAVERLGMAYEQALAEIDAEAAKPPTALQTMFKGLQGKQLTGMVLDENAKAARRANAAAALGAAVAQRANDYGGIALNIPPGTSLEFKQASFPVDISGTPYTEPLLCECNACKAFRGAGMIGPNG